MTGPRDRTVIATAISDLERTADVLNTTMLDSVIKDLRTLLDPPPLTSKQRLVAHIEAMHGGIRPTNRGESARLAGHPRPSWTLKQLADWHTERHHQYVTNHYHVGPNRGPGERPPGWLTGGDAVLIGGTPLGRRRPPFLRDGRCTIGEPHCSHCGRTGVSCQDHGYSSCCNEPIVNDDCCHYPENHEEVPSA